MKAVEHARYTQNDRTVIWAFEQIGSEKLLTIRNEGAVILRQSWKKALVPD